MANRLQDVFSNDDYELGLKLYFDNIGDRADFLKALNAVYDEGNKVELENVTAFSPVYTRGSVEYPLTIGEVSSVTIIPAYIPIPINTRIGKREIKFKKCKKDGTTILETDHDAIIYLRISRGDNSNIVSFTYRVQYQYAKSIAEILESICDLLGFMDYLVGEDRGKQDRSELDGLFKMRKAAEAICTFFERLCALEQELNLIFDPKNIGEIDHFMQDVDELYVMLVLKQIIRPNVEITIPEDAGITLETGNRIPKIGTSLDMVYVGAIKYTIFGHEILVHTANLLSNAVIKEVRIDNNKRIKLLYDRSDDKPMLLACKGFANEKDAINEAREIMKNKESYVGSLTAREYLKNNK